MEADGGHCSAFIIRPWNTEDEGPFGFNHDLKQSIFSKISSIFSDISCI